MVAKSVSGPSEPFLQGNTRSSLSIGAQQSMSDVAVEKLLTSQQVSRIFQKHPKVIERMAKRGEIPAFKVGKSWRYRASELDNWITSQLQSARQTCRTQTSF